MGLAVRKGVEHLSDVYKDLFRLRVKTIRIDQDDCARLTQICMLAGSILRIPLKQIADKVARNHAYEYYTYGITKDGRNITDLTFYLKER